MAVYHLPDFFGAAPILLDFAPVRDHSRVEPLQSDPMNHFEFNSAELNPACLHLG